MITLITAKPGCGKSQLAVKLIVQAVKSGRQVFADIAGLDVDEIQRRYGGLRVLPSPADWRDTPEGSLVVYDEAQGRFPSTGKPGRPDDPVLQALEVHRHTGHDLIFVTQEPTFVHHHIRKLAGEHKALHRAMGRKGAIVYTWENQIGDPEDSFSKRSANTENFSYSKEWQTLYKSSTIHTHKFKLPSRFLWLAAAILLVVSWPIYRIASGQFINPSSSTLSEVGIISAEPPQAPDAEGGRGGASPVVLPVSSEFAWRAAPQVPALNGCVSGRHCRCWDFDGLLVDIPEGVCRSLAEGITPMPIDLNRFMGSSQQGSPGVVASSER